MAHQSSQIMDLIDTLIVSNPTLNKPLEKINQLVDWTAFEEIFYIIWVSYATVST